jgi:hypothetical protein
MKVSVPRRRRNPARDRRIDHRIATPPRRRRQIARRGDIDGRTINQQGMGRRMADHLVIDPRTMAPLGSMEITASASTTASRRPAAISQPCSRARASASGAGPRRRPCARPVPDWRPSPAHIAQPDKAYPHRLSPLAQPMVGMMKALSPSDALSGQRAVTVLTLVQKRTPSMPCWLVSPKPLRFHPPKL